MTATTFPTYTAETAPESARSRVERVTAQLGFTPAAVGRMAGSPELLATFLQANGYFERCSLTALQREVVIMTVARRHGCHLCLAMHTAALHRLGGDEALIAALRDGTAVTDVQLEALRTFTLTVMDRHGAVEAEAIDALLAAGYERRHALDVVLGIGVYTLSTYANRLTEAPVDEAFQAFA
ncbi:MAG TPA: carboxymuconolactone decarboxylase family protein [Candidatus Ruania gallistercoris]|uniref:Carboxymuconolactone decarboxylase family protein n=1 Tax=Candidatus Ruania gallistercoris TaxID=2838746 RepID=A0A9D2ECC7_9MICO|nr:carboxymuconolactone decarboxylase family protein [Candidatus Ruania gallistercoris]